MRSCETYFFFLRLVRSVRQDVRSAFGAFPALLRAIMHPPVLYCSLLCFSCVRVHVCMCVGLGGEERNIQRDSASHAPLLRRNLVVASRQESDLLRGKRSFMPLLWCTPRPFSHSLSYHHLNNNVIVLNNLSIGEAQAWLPRGSFSDQLNPSRDDLRKRLRKMWIGLTDRFLFVFVRCAPWRIQTAQRKRESDSRD